MFRDSYQKFIGSPTGDDSIEAAVPRHGDVENVSHVGCYMEVASIPAESGTGLSTKKDLGRSTSELSVRTAAHDRRRKRRNGRNNHEVC